jgi:hypothetical protein
VNYRSAAILCARPGSPFAAATLPTRAALLRPALGHAKNPHRSAAPRSINRFTVDLIFAIFRHMKTGPLRRTCGRGQAGSGAAAFVIDFLSSLSAAAVRRRLRSS